MKAKHKSELREQSVDQLHDKEKELAQQLFISPKTADHHVSAVTGAGVAGLLEALVTQGKGMMPTDGAIALNERQSIELETVAKALLQADGDDVLILAEGLRQARVAFDRITGRAGVEDFLDTLFGNFCLGK